MTTPTTIHPEYSMRAPDEPQQRDDRHPGVHLLEFDGDECKTTAEFIDGKYWVITDWELFDLDGGLYWMPRFWHTLAGPLVETLGRLQALEMAHPPAEQGALDLGPQA
jgi:hypothetical protein